MENNKDAVKTQGVKGKKQKASPTYTLRATRENIRKLEELKLITEEQAKTMKEILGKALLEYIGGEAI